MKARKGDILKVLPNLQKTLQILFRRRKKKMKKIQKRITSGTLSLKENDPFELFVAATNVRYCYYNETHTILGSTYGMLVLQVGS